MKDIDEQNLERVVSRELKRLPQLQAPETLFHRVMLEVHTRARQPWWQRSWQGWPPAFQATTLLALLLLATGASYWLSATVHELPYEVLEATFLEWAGPMAQLWQLGETLVGAVWLVMRSGGQMFLLYGSLVILSVYAVAIGLGAAVTRALVHRVENGRL